MPKAREKNKKKSTRKKAKREFKCEKTNAMENIYDQ